MLLHDLNLFDVEPVFTLAAVAVRMQDCPSS